MTNRAIIHRAGLRGAVLVLFLLATGALAEPIATLPRIVVLSNQFVVAGGKPVVFHGINASDPDKLAHEGRWNKTYFQQMRAWGANAVRLPIHPIHWRERGQRDYLKLLDRGIRWAGEENLYVILDWHSIGNLEAERFFAGNKPPFTGGMYGTTKAETFAFWKTMAQRYGANSTVAFFELFNEPTVINGQLGACSWEQWRALMESMIDHVRTNGCLAIPLIAGFDWGYDLTPVAAAPIRAEGIGYVSHPYPMKRSQPWDSHWNADWGFAAEKYPVFLTEIAFCGADDKGAHSPVISDETYGAAITGYCAKRGISYAVWVFDPDWAPRLITDWSFTPSRQGVYFRNAMLVWQH
jgi:hypothetical protein